MRDALGFLSLLSSVRGTPPWWSEDPFRVMVEAVLVQNTAWENVLRTREEIGDRLSPQWVESLDDMQLEEAIRSCGFQKAKARTIRALTAWWRSFAFECDAVMAIGAQDLISQLQSIKGVGMETASVIALYAFHKPVMVVDAYTRRILSRFGYSFEDDDSIRSFFCSALGFRELGALHWLILETGKAWCRRRPLCDSCPLCGGCMRII